MTKSREREYTVAKLIEELSLLPSEAKVTITDADTYWTIPKFSLIYKDGVVDFYPCDYGDMIS